MNFKKITFAFVIYFLTGMLTLYSQNEFGTGLILDDSLFEKEVALAPVILEEGRRASDLPRWFSLRPFSPIPKHQGKINSCVGWAMGYGAMTIQKAFKNQETNRRKITKDAFSAMFIYNQAKMGGCFEGAYIHHAAKVLVEKGNCKSNDFDYPYHECDRTPKDEILTHSKKNIIQDFIALFNKKTKYKTKVLRTKKSIAQGKPIIIGLKVFQSLKKLNSEDHIWKPSNNEDDKELGGHSLVVVGYNDSLGVFEIMNSWGAKWGDSGFFYLSYRDFAERVFQGVQLVFPDEKITATQKNLLARDLKKARAQKKLLEQKIEEHTSKNSQTTTQVSLAEENNLENEVIKTNLKIRKTQNQLVSLSGVFQVRYLKTDDFGTPLKNHEGEFQFENISATRKDDVYILGKKDWEEGDMFQLLANEIRTNSYLYVFSIDGNNKVEIHFPRPTKSNESQFSKSEIILKSALVADLESTIVLPSEDRLFVKENMEDDNICVFYSRRKIDNFQEMVNLIQKEEGAIEVRIKKVLGTKMISSSDCRLSSENMKFTIPHEASGEVFPLIVKIVF